MVIAAKRRKVSPSTTPLGPWFDVAAADRAVRFFTAFLRHGKGEWAGKPFLLLPWQERVVRDLFGWKRPDGTRQYRRCYICIGRKNGKALAIDTPIPTPGGWTTMGNIRVGDSVFDENGKPLRVVAATGVQFGRTCYKVVFSDGTSIVADAAHQWYTDARHSGLPRTGLGPKSTWSQRHIRTTEEIRATLRADPGSSKVEWNHRIPVAAPLELPTVSLPVDPYVLGMWLGDGDSKGAGFTVGEQDRAETIQLLTAAGTRVDEAPTRRSRLWLGSNKDPSQCSRGHPRGSRPGRCNTCDRERGRADRRGLPRPPKTRISLNETLGRLGLIGNKHIPPVYLRASAAQRLALLQGLMDTDGSAILSGPLKVPRCEFSTIRPILRDGIVELIRGLGYKPTVMTVRARGNGKDCGEAYRVCFTAFADLPVFRLRRKADRLRRLRPGERPRSLYRQIIAINPVPSTKVRCIQVDSVSGLYLAGEGMVPTHNSQIAAAIALYLLFSDGEPGAEVYSAALDRAQAAIVFDAAKSMIAASPTLASRCEVYRSSIVVPATGSRYKVLSADAPNAQGLNASGIIFDELHVQPDRELWDVLNTATGARRQPLTLAITTAGYDRHSICWEIHDYAMKVQAGIIPDPAFLPVIYAAGDDDDWTLPATWAKANPSMGVTVSQEYLAAECQRAQDTPGYQNTFKRLHLDIWTQQESRWLDMATWDAADPAADPESLEGRPCWAGLDLASTSDIAAFVAVFPSGGGYDILCLFWVPEENIGARALQDRVPYEVWARDGLITPTPGNRIDYDRIRADIGALSSRFDIREIAIDRWNSTQLQTQLMGDGLTVVPFGQGFASMTAPAKALESLVAEHKFRHGGNPVLRWMASNVAVEQDAAGNLKPSKARSSEKIDGIVSAIMAIGRAMVTEGASVYDTRGMLSLEAL